jgi:hypothetical protein
MRGFTGHASIIAVVVGTALGVVAASQAVKRAGATTAGPAAALAMIAAPGAGGCFPAVSASGEALLQSQAQAAAIRAWKDAAASTGFNDYDHAQAISMTCQRRTPLRWSCALTAQPCVPGGSANSAATPACYPTLTVTGGWAKLQSGAQEKARDQWQHDAGIAYGTNYKWWNKSNNRDTTCHHDGKGPLTRQWQCVAHADPCL